METALQSSVYVASPEFAGWLQKRGFHWRKLWKRRWVALHGAEIVYMDREPTIENSNSLVITKAQITTATVIIPEDLDGNPNGFTIHINDGATPPWYLRAESVREKKSWLLRLSHVHAIVKWLEEFEKVKVLGVGGSGIVYELLHKSNGQRYAMKEMEIKNKSQMRLAIQEAEMLKDIMENVSHPRIMHIEKVFQVGSKFYLVFPLCTGGELYEHIIRKGHFTEHDAAVIMRDLISGLHALHAHDILHLDIKPENILFDGTGDDARIMITDFGLSKLFRGTESDMEKTAFSMNLMQERLQIFASSGQLNSEKLRGTIGYMAPELILTGHCMKATDVFAAGVVLYILLCGRPPFHSRNNREVLEATVRGTFSLTGPEWEEVSLEAKDLVRRMLVVNPEERISTAEFLSHKWMKNLEEDEKIAQSAAEDGEPSALLKIRQTTRLGSNLTGALRHLSGHVKQMRTEKMASNVTKIMTLMQARSGSVLSRQYLVPPPSAGEVLPSPENDDYDSILLNSDFREALVTALMNMEGLSDGRMTLEQFTLILKHLNNLQGASNTVSLGPLIMGKFMDRDGDGLITADDIFAGQAQIMQRSEEFLQVVFRIYAEAVWYPGRQLNYMSLMHASGDATNPSTNPNNVSGAKVLGDAQNRMSAMVEPPKFITVRHVTAVFEKLGYDPSGATKVFNSLVELASRVKDASGDEPTEEEDGVDVDSLPGSPNAALAKALDNTEGEGRSSTTSSSTAKLSQRDFVRVCELDDVLVQAIFRRSRSRLIGLFNAAENRAAGDLAVVNEGDESDDTASDATNIMPASRKSTKDFAASVIEEELKRALSQLSVSETTASTRSFPIANAVGRATLSAALGIAAKMTSASAMIRDATYEALDPIEDDRPSISSAIALDDALNSDDE